MSGDGAVVVIGGTRGIGLEIVRHYADAGRDVEIRARTDPLLLARLRLVEVRALENDDGHVVRMGVQRVVLAGVELRERLIGAFGRIAREHGLRDARDDLLELGLLGRDEDRLAT